MIAPIGFHETEDEYIARLEAEIVRLEGVVRPEVQSEYVLVPKVALAWLNGEAPAPDGKWFGECEDDATAPGRIFPRKYWWRTKFRELCGSAPAAQAQPEPVAAALARRLCQMFDNGGESQRSARARHASVIFQILNRKTPEYAVEQAKCDADPVGYLRAAEGVAIPSADLGGGK